jgi:hypothetical protein
MSAVTLAPSSSFTMRRAYSACEWERVAMTMVVPSPLSSVSRCITSSPLAESKLPVGSSATIDFGFETARAMATRCCWPPDTCRAMCRARWWIFTFLAPCASGPCAHPARYPGDGGVPTRCSPRPLIHRRDRRSEGKADAVLADCHGLVFRTTCNVLGAKYASNQRPPTRTKSAQCRKLPGRRSFQRHIHTLHGGWVGQRVRSRKQTIGRAHIPVKQLLASGLIYVFQRLRRYGIAKKRPLAYNSPHTVRIRTHGARASRARARVRHARQQRRTHSWPPQLDLPAHRVEPVRCLIEELNLPVADAYSGMTRVQAFVDRIIHT